MLIFKKTKNIYILYLCNHKSSALTFVEYYVKLNSSKLVDFHALFFRWCSLTTHITDTTLTRVQPRCGLIHAATALLSNPEAARDVNAATSVEEKLDAQFVQDEDQIMQ